MTSRDDHIRQLCERAIMERTFPGCVVGYMSETATIIRPFGQLRYEADAPLVTAHTIYDVASVTKSVTTGAVALKLIEDGVLQLDNPLVRWVPELTNSYREKITLWHLLTYTAIFEIPGGLSAIALEEPKRLFSLMCQAPLVAKPGARYYYTNPPAILLATLIQRATGRRLDDMAQEYFYGPMGMDSTTLHPETLDTQDIAPTEIDWRGEVRGVVHDEAAWAMAQSNQIAGNAGLFTNTADLLKFSQMLLAHGVYNDQQLFTAETVKSMHTNQLKSLGETAGLGWELDRPDTMGVQGSNEIFGKTGFTGSVMMIDPLKHRALVHLSNRTYPKRTANRDAINAFRRELADIVFAA